MVTTSRDSELCPTTLIYTIYPQGIVDLDVTFAPKTEALRRAGLVCAINPEFSQVNYYALGPWENYNDRKDGCLVGRYTTTVEDMVEPYVKPQSMGNREGLRELTLTNETGTGIVIETEGEVAFSALPYTDQDLMRANHIWNAEKKPYTVLHLDATLRGVGNASCGSDVDTLPIYRVAQDTQSYKLRISTTK